MAPSDDDEKRISTPVVLAAASAMISIGVVAFLTSSAFDDGAEPPPMVETVRAAVDTSSPLSTAESFLDAWRKRDHESALALSVDSAEQEVLDRREREASASAEDRRLKRQVWDAMASNRLSIEVEEERALDGGGVVLSGIASGEFLNAPYRRRVEFEVVARDGGHKVRSMRLGLVLTDTPEFLDLRPEEGAP